MIFLSSDWHLGHEKLVDMGVRPTDADSRIIANLLDRGSTPNLRKPQPKDTLLCLGDVYLGHDGECLAASLLEGLRERGVSTVLTIGNHDARRITKLADMGWNWVCDQTSLRYHGATTLFSHEPVEDLDAKYDFNIHGHLHSIGGHRGSLIRDGRHILISSELLDYRPIPLDRVIELGATPQWQGGKFVRAEPVPISGALTENR